MHHLSIRVGQERLEFHKGDGTEGSVVQKAVTAAKKFIYRWTVRGD